VMLGKRSGRRRNWRREERLSCRIGSDHRRRGEDLCLFFLEFIDVFVPVDGGGVFVVAAAELGNHQKEEQEGEAEEAEDGAAHCDEPLLPRSQIIIVVLDVDRIRVGIDHLIALCGADDDIIDAPD